MTSALADGAARTSSARRTGAHRVTPSARDVSSRGRGMSRPNRGGGASGSFSGIPLASDGDGGHPSLSAEVGDNEDSTDQSGEEEGRADSEPARPQPVNRGSSCDRVAAASR